MSTMVTHPIAPAETDNTPRTHSPRKLDWIRRSESFTAVDIIPSSTRFAAGPSHGVRRIASDSNPWGRKLIGPVTGMDVHEPENKRYSLEGGAASDTGSPSERETRGHMVVERGDSMRGIMKNTRAERSVSRGRAHVEKSIEATVKKPEMGGNARSRKASHMMGLFDPRTGSESPATVPDDHTLSSEEPPKSSSRPTSPLYQSTVSPWATRRSSREAIDVPIAARDPSRAGSAYGSKPVSPLKHDHDPYFRQQDLAQRPALQESRVSFKASRAPTPSDTVVETEAQDQHAFADEHISAAVYYPHSGPSPEEIELYTSPGEVASPELVKSRPLPPPIGDVLLTADAKAHEALGGAAHIDISVVSQHEKKVFHGNYRPLEEEAVEDLLPLSPFSEAPNTAIVTTSESELESGDETGLPDDIATTPTQRSTLTRRPTESQASTKTKAKVVLEPYKHQIGGHSTIFRFSRRAVCKQLNNRENEFYERIEQRHPDMLKFLPR